MNKRQVKIKAFNANRVIQDLTIRKHTLLVKTDVDILDTLNLNRNHELITEMPALNYRSLQV